MSLIFLHCWSWWASPGHSRSFSCFSAHGIHRPEILAPPSSPSSATLLNPRMALFLRIISSLPWITSARSCTAMDTAPPSMARLLTLSMASASVWAISIPLIVSFASLKSDRSCPSVTLRPVEGSTLMVALVAMRITPFLIGSSMPMIPVSVITPGKVLILGFSLGFSERSLGMWHRVLWVLAGMLLTLLQTLVLLSMCLRSAGRTWIKPFVTPALLLRRPPFSAVLRHWKVGRFLPAASFVILTPFSGIRTRPIPLLQV